MKILASFKEHIRRLYANKLFSLCIVIFLVWLIHKQLMPQNMTIPTFQVLQALNLNYRNSNANLEIFDLNKTFEGVEASQYKFHLCNCIRRYRKDRYENESSLLQSTCSDFSTRRGNGQLVISYSYYSKDNNIKKGSRDALRYLEALRDRVSEAKSIYPDWIIRIYTDVTRSNGYATQVLCDVYCSDDQVDLCDVSNLPIIGSTYRNYNGMFWRFLPLGDPTVHIFLSRDLDSVIQRREFEAVSEWLISNKTFHVMRDHPSHKPVILGGLWGAKNVDKINLTKLREKLLSTVDEHRWGYDQETLKNVLWPVAKDDILQHDSFLCGIHSGSKPFPTKRVVNVYVGWGPHGKEGPLRTFQKKDCPPKCRKHLSWTRC
ncbi:UNVERIFIED_CONTAM: hypothetical protein RMT77_004923 [Armadillidium vulgare]